MQQQVNLPVTKASFAVISYYCRPGEKKDVKNKID